MILYTAAYEQRIQTEYGEDWSTVFRMPGLTAEEAADALSDYEPAPLPRRSGSTYPPPYIYLNIYREDTGEGPLDPKDLLW